MNIPDYVQSIANTLISNGFDAYLVGGCLRDTLIGVEPKDWDIATTATPRDVQELFEKTIPVGELFGTVIVVTEDYDYCEVTTLRKDGEYSNYRHPADVQFVCDIAEDLARRDFTVNAIAYNLKTDGFIDPFNGQADLLKGEIKAVNDPNERFTEDALRILRAVRFACQLDFGIEPETYTALKKHSKLLKKISKERVRDEFNKILLSNHPYRGLEYLKDIDVLFKIIPELRHSVDFDQNNPNHDKDVFNHTLEVVRNCASGDVVLLLSALLHDIGKPHTYSEDVDTGYGHFYDHHKVGEAIAKFRLKSLKYDNSTIDKVAVLVREHMSRFPKVRQKSVKKLMTRLGEENIYNFIKLQRADIKGSKTPHDFSLIDDLEDEIYRIRNSVEPMSVKDLAINGNDLKNMGIPEGVHLGDVLKILLEDVLEDPSLNQFDILIEKAKDVYKKISGVEICLGE